MPRPTKRRTAKLHLVVNSACMDHIQRHTGRCSASASTGHLERGTKHAIRSRDQLGRASSLKHVDLEESTGVPVAKQLADVLVKNAVRVIDLFREWDEDGSGTIDRKEFRRAMPLLGLDVPREVVDELFDHWDPDQSGELTIRELNQKLRRRVAVPQKPKKKLPHGPAYGRIGYASFGRQPLSARANSPSVSFGIGPARTPLSSRPKIKGLIPEYQSCLEQDQPPPNKYDLGLDRPLAFRWGGKGTVFGSEEQRPINGGPLGGNRTGPGPARYHVNTRAGTPHPDGRSRTPQAYTINGKWSFTGSLESKSNRVPGPGHYNLHPTLGAQVLSRSKSATSFSFGTSPSRIAVTPGYRPHGTGMLLPARFKTDTTPGAIY